MTLDKEETPNFPLHFSGEKLEVHGMAKNAKLQKNNSVDTLPNIWNVQCLKFFVRLSTKRVK